MLSPDSGSAQLAENARKFMGLHQEAYGSQFLKPKHHWLLDIAPQITRDRVVLDAFVIERQHLLVKSLAEHVRNTSDYEKSVLASVVTVQSQEARAMVIGDGLVGATARLAEMPRVTVAKKMVIFDFVISVGEVVLRVTEAGIVAACARDDSGFFFFVTPLTTVEEVTPLSCKCRLSSAMVVWRATEVRQCSAWREEPDGLVLVIGV